MQILLEKEGYAVAVSYSAEDALAHLAENRVSALVLDINLPKMNGLEMLQEIKSRPEGADLPVIVVSGRELAEIPALPYPVVLDWLTKPLDEGRLLERLKEAVRKDEPPTVLIVDDDTDLCVVLSRLLDKNGARVETAPSGRKAVEMCRQKLPDLMILDLVMPDGDGFYVIDMLRRDLELRKVPIIVYSAKEPTPAERRRLAVGTTLFLTKAKTSQQEFMERVVELLNGLLPVPPSAGEGDPPDGR